MEFILNRSISDEKALKIPRCTNKLWIFRQFFLNLSQGSNSFDHQVVYHSFELLYSTDQGCQIGFFKPNFKFLALFEHFGLNIVILAFSRILAKFWFVWKISRFSICESSFGYPHCWDEVRYFYTFGRIKQHSKQQQKESK